MTITLSLAQPLGEQLKKIRIDMRLQQQEIAVALNSDTANISRFEKNSGENTNVAYAIRYAIALGAESVTFTYDDTPVRYVFYNGKSYPFKAFKFKRKNLIAVCSDVPTVVLLTVGDWPEIVAHSIVPVTTEEFHMPDDELKHFTISKSQ